ncbi:hypothetical protein OS42_24500 [Dickeya oryzae]
MVFEIMPTDNNCNKEKSPMINNKPERKLRRYWRNLPRKPERDGVDVDMTIYSLKKTAANITSLNE